MLRDMLEMISLKLYGAVAKYGFPQRLGPCPNSWNWWLCSLPWQRDFADVSQLNTLRWGAHAGVPGWPQRHHNSPGKSPRKRMQRLE